jgi:hypothetical protein
MQRLPLLCLALIVGCANSPDVESPTPNRSTVVATPPMETTPTPLKPNTHKTAESMFKKARLDVRRQRIREQKYTRQDTLKPMPTLSSELVALVPPGLAHKKIGFELHHGMKQVKPAPMRRFHLLRWLTMTRGPSLRRTLKAHIQSRGWVANGQLVTEGFTHHKLGRLNLQIQEQPESPTELTVTIESKLGMKIALPWKDLASPTPWLDPLKGMALVGFELSRFHGVHFGASFTDIERMAIALRPVNGETFRAQLEKEALLKGFVRRAETSQSLIHKKNKQSLRITDDNDGLFIVHVHSRWGDSKSVFKKLIPRR